MKLKFSLIALSIMAVSHMAHAASIELVNSTPKAGQMVVQYQFLNADKEPEGMIATTIIPNTVTLPTDATGIRVLTVQNASLPSSAKMPGGWFSFPAPSCTWTRDAGRKPVISFDITAHSISCH